MMSRMTHGRRVRAGLLAAVAILVATAVMPMLPAGAATATAPRTSLPTCQTGNLQGSLVINTGSEAAGSSFVHIDLLNSGRTTCQLSGDPGVSAYNGHQVGGAAAWSPGFPKTPVILQPGQVANSLLQIVRTANFPASTCRPITVSTLRVFPPNQSQSLLISSSIISISVCSGSNTSLIVRPVVAGTGQLG